MSMMVGFMVIMFLLLTFLWTQHMLFLLATKLWKVIGITRSSGKCYNALGLCLVLL